MAEKLNIPLMQNNIEEDDYNVLIDFLKQKPFLTQSQKVRDFEKAWSQWLGVKHSVFVNSGSSANLLTMFAIKELYGTGEVILPPLTWVSDVASVLHAGHKPVFCDIQKENLAMNPSLLTKAINSKTRAVFLTHILGLNGLTDEIYEVCKKRNILLIEDVCESHGATFNGAKLGSLGFASNFSFYYAHHMTTIEGGMISTNSEDFYEVCRMFRGHGMNREMDSVAKKSANIQSEPDLNADFIFHYPAFNCRSTEINAALGLHQLKKLDQNNIKRNENWVYFLSLLDPQKYYTQFNNEGCSNYAFILLISEKIKEKKIFAERIKSRLKELNVEFRQGTSGGGNQLRQPYLKRILPKEHYKLFPECDYVHFYGFYIGNYPSLEKEKITKLAEALNNISHN